MTQSVLISIRPKWCELIANGEKTVEVRKTRPKIETPFRCYIYCTKPTFPHEDYIFFMDNEEEIHGLYGGGKVIGEFVCDEIDVYEYDYCTHPEIGMDYDCGDNWFCIDNADLEKACLSYEDFRLYAGNKDMYGWHISELKIYDKPKELKQFQIPTTIPARRVRQAPQSWCYIEEVE